MLDQFTEYLIQLGLPQLLAGLLCLIFSLSFILALSLLANLLTKRYLLQLIRGKLNQAQSVQIKILAKHQVFRRLSHLIPSVVIFLSLPYLSIDILPVTSQITAGLKIIAQIYVIGAVFLITCALLDYTDDLYNHTISSSKRKPIKSYLQVIKLVLFVLCLILATSIVLNKSPLVFLTGLGAMTAFTTLIFKDSIMGFVASVQMASYDIMRIGDWVEIPNFSADGDVVDLSLNTVKIQNFDKTIVTIPTHELLNCAIKNWRGMSDSGGRRIKRAIFIDLHTIRFCLADDLKRYQQLDYLQDYIDKQMTEINHYNQQQSQHKALPANGRHLTNIGLFRAYTEAYLRHHPSIHQQMTFLIRQLAPTELGLPIELYVFTNTTDWLQYERIQADIFDHLLAVISYLDLKVYQRLSDQGSASGSDNRCSP